MYKTIKDAYNYGLSSLLADDSKNNKESAVLDSQILLIEALGITKEYFYTHPEAEINKDKFTLYKKYISQRKKGYCVAVILGKKDFYKYTFSVSKHTLVPRQDSECLVKNAIIVAKDILARQKNISILDLCTGTGCLGLSIAKDLNDQGFDTNLTLSDLSIRALEIAKINAEALNIKADIIKSNLFAELKFSKYDIIVSNPPYIPKKMFENLATEVRLEPKIALCYDRDGCGLIKKIIKNAKKYLKNDGVLIIEMDYLQVDDMINYSKKYKFNSNQIIYDLSGRKRAILLRN